MTADFVEKGKDLQWYFGHFAKNSDRVTFFYQENIDYVFYGPEERALLDPETPPLPLPIVFENNEITIYAVEEPTDSSSTP